MDNQTSLGHYIRESRLQQGMSLGQLAERLGRSSSSVRRWERDEVSPAIAIMPSLAEALAVDVETLQERRPQLEDLDDTGSHTAGGEQIHSTIEQPVVAGLRNDGSDDSGSQNVGRMAVPLGLFGDMWNTVFAKKTSWIGWVRGVSTALVLVVMVFVLVWAAGELLEALSDVWHSVGTDSTSS
ncbi:MAG: helix-turn-helix transcriptional regulator [Actinomycetota bacterium]|nr:helix-turn-helix transcriptional regulator [Actinomycetota bacterium]